MNKKSLTHREIEVAELLVLGHSAVSICNILCIALSTVKSHIHSIYSKYGLVDDLYHHTDPSKRVRFINLWNKEKYGDIDFILAQNKDVLQQNLSLQKERLGLLNVLKQVLFSCTQCDYSKNNKGCAEDTIKNALLNYSYFGGENVLQSAK